MLENPIEADIDSPCIARIPPAQPEDNQAKPRNFPLETVLGNS
jgi:hypothetical protein